MSARKRIVPMVWTLVPALLTLSVIGYALFLASGNAPVKNQLLEGKALASYSPYYPVQVRQDGSLQLDPVRFMKAVDYFSNQPPTRAAGELIYIGQHNNVALLLNDAERARYAALMKNPAYAKYKAKDEDDPLAPYKTIVDGIGQTFHGTGVEIVLHDTRNPLKSVAAIQNPITGRQLGDANTNFGYELIKAYAAIEEEGRNFVSYALSTKDGRKVKSTTIPIYQEKNLIGFICLNIDISKLEGGHREAEAALIQAFSRTSRNDKINEVIENTSVNLLTMDTRH